MGRRSAFRYDKPEVLSARTIKRREPLAHDGYVITKWSAKLDCGIHASRGISGATARICYWDELKNTAQKLGDVNNALFTSLSNEEAILGLVISGNPCFFQRRSHLFKHLIYVGRNRAPTRNMMTAEFRKQRHLKSKNRTI